MAVSRRSTSTVVGWSALVALTVLALLTDVVPSKAVELLLLCAVVAVAVPMATVRSIARNLGPLGLMVTASVGLMFGLVQFGPVGARDLYPFVDFSLYTDATEQEGFLAVTLTDRGGRDLGPVPFASLVPTSAPRAFIDRLGPTISAAAAGDESARELLRRTFAQLMPQAASENQGIRVRRCIVADPTPDAPADCTEVLHLLLGPGST